MKLSTGKDIYVNCDLISISPDLILYEGYDGNISEKLTPAEKVEIADILNGGPSLEIGLRRSERRLVVRIGLARNPQV